MDGQDFDVTHMMFNLTIMHYVLQKVEVANFEIASDAFSTFKVMKVIGDFSFYKTRVTRNTPDDILHLND